MAGYGDRAASLLDSKPSTGAGRSCAKSAKSAISPPLDAEPGCAKSAESAKSPDPFVRWQDGHSQIVLLEMTGGPVPQKWYAALAQLELECMAVEIFARGAGREQMQGTQAELFDAPRRYF